MANFAKIMKTAVSKTPGKKLMNFLPKTAGAKGYIKLTKPQLQGLAKTGSPELGAVLKPILQSAKNPSLEIAYKAKSNYSIAGLRIKDGKEVLTQGAVSVSGAGTKAPVIKAHLSAGHNGEIGSANAFLDTGKKVNVKNLDFNLGRKNQTINANVRADRAFGANCTVDEQKLVEQGKKFHISGVKNLIERYNKTMTQGQKGIDNGLRQIKNFLV